MQSDKIAQLNTEKTTGRRELVLAMKNRQYNMEYWCMAAIATLTFLLHLYFRKLIHLCNGFVRPSVLLLVSNSNCKRSTF